MIIANTTKGKGVPEIEGDFKYHALPLTLEQLERASKSFHERIEKIAEEMTKFSLTPLWSRIGSRDPRLCIPEDLREIISRNPSEEYNAPTATRIGYGNCLSRLGEYRGSMF